MGASAVRADRDDLLDDVRLVQGHRSDQTALRLALLAAVSPLANKSFDLSYAGNDL